MQPEKQNQKNLNKRKIALSRIKRQLLKHVWAVRVGLIALIFLCAYFFCLIASFTFGKLGINNYLGLVGDFVFTPTQKVQTSTHGTNILVLGKAGEGHEAPDLTDTIIFTSISQSQSTSALISLPRDIWVPELRAKLNSTYYWGNQQEEGGGLVLAKSTVEKIIGQPVHYGLVIDFEGFTKVIDVIGGIEVEVEREFTDEKYPIAGKENDECDGDPEYKCRYETARFEKGIQTMDGETALVFARSRNAEGDEGTDLAREARQQKIVAAIKDKILSPETLLSVKKVASIWKVVQESVETDIDASAAAIISRKLFDSRKDIDSYVIPEDMLINPPAQSRYDYLYVFTPRDRSWQEIQEWVEAILINNSPTPIY